MIRSLVFCERQWKQDGALVQRAHHAYRTIENVIDGVW